MCLYVHVSDEENRAPFPRTKWQAECGFIYVLMQGYYPENHTYHVLKPTGKCSKCKDEITTI
jgi:hypothetical protein